MQRKLSPAATIMAVFFMQAFAAAGSFSRLAEIQEGMGASAAALGLALLGFDLGGFASFPFAGRVIERLGVRITLLFGIPLFALAAALPAMAPNPIIFFFLAPFVAAGFTFTNIAMNVEADRVEYATGRRIMNRCHGLWSLGFLAASGIGTLASAAHILPWQHLLGVVPVALVGTLLVVLPMQEAAPRPHTGGERPPRFAMPTMATLLLIAFALGSILLEACIRSWSVIYLRDVFHTANWIATITLSVAVGAQVVGRLFADRWIERHGPVIVAGVLSAIALAGLLLVVWGASVPLSFLGFALIGFGVASAFPQALSAAARLGDRPAAENVAALSLMNSVVLFLTPPLVGFTASQWGIRASFALILPFALLAIVLAGNLADRPKAVAA
jgi:MFS family permease